MSQQSLEFRRQMADDGGMPHTTSKGPTMTNLHTARYQGLSWCRRARIERAELARYFGGRADGRPVVFDVNSARTVMGLYR